jgi:hypothetical protein
VSEYVDHHTLTAPRLAVLRAIARGECPAVNRNRIAWLVRHGFLKKISKPLEPPQHQLTELGWQRVGECEASDGIALSAEVGYVAGSK